MVEVNEISMYWWEGFYGFDNFFRRLTRLKNPYIKNFGDLLSPFIISLLTHKIIRHSISSKKLLALGSIFFALRDKDVVWGSGFLNAKHIQYALDAKEVNYLAVRGPETRSLLVKNGIQCPEIYGDPAILLPRLIKNDIQKKYAIGIVPHFSHYSAFKKSIERPDVNVINVESYVTEVIKSLLACEIILATSLHGLIIAEAYDIPALLVTVDTLPGDMFKFKDYFHSTNRSLHYEQFSMAKLYRLADLAIKQNKPSFATDKLLHSFPFGLSNMRESLYWSTIQNTRYRHSVMPPKFSVL